MLPDGLFKIFYNLKEKRKNNLKNRLTLVTQ